MNIFSWLAKYSPPRVNLVGWISFQIALFLLPSSAFISLLFLILALFLGSSNRSKPYFRDFWNYPFFLAGCFMIVGSISAYSGWLAWAGLANWLPFFWAFWAFQSYLRTAAARERCALLFVCGTIPVLLTGFGQLWFNWSGPWQLFNGLIVWFIAPGGNPLGRLSGLFDYANIAGSWLALVWPFSLALVIHSSTNRFRRIFFFVLASSIVVALIMTDSRNAWGGLLLGIPFVLGPIQWPWLLPLMVLLFIPVALAILPGVGLEIQELSRKIVPEGLWSRLNDMRYINERSLASTRISQWSVALRLVLEKPFLGWGAAAFSVLYPLRTGIWHGHSHNLPLELAVSHGTIVSILIVSNVIALIIASFRYTIWLNNINRNNDSNVIDRAWWTSTFILLCLHGADIPLFDSRINIAGWILLAGLKCLLDEKKKITFVYS